MSILVLVCGGAAAADDTGRQGGYWQSIDAQRVQAVQRNSRTSMADAIRIAEGPGGKAVCAKFHPNGLRGMYDSSGNMSQMSSRDQSRIANTPVYLVTVVSGNRFECVAISADDGQVIHRVDKGSNLRVADDEALAVSTAGYSSGSNYQSGPSSYQAGTSGYNTGYVSTPNQPYSSGTSSNQTSWSSPPNQGNGSVPSGTYQSGSNYQSAGSGYQSSPSGYNTGYGTSSNQPYTYNTTNQPYGTSGNQTNSSGYSSNPPNGSQSGTGYQSSSTGSNIYNTGYGTSSNPPSNQPYVSTANQSNWSSSSSNPGSGSNVYTGSAYGSSGTGTGYSSNNLSTSNNSAFSAPRSWQRADELLGKDVRSTSGETIGRLEDVIVDVPSHRVVWGIISLGGYTGSSDKLCAVPWEAFRIQPGSNELMVSVDRSRLVSATSFTGSSYPTFADSSWASQNFSQFGYQPYWTTSTSGMSSSQREWYAQPSSTRRLSQLRNGSVRTSSGQTDVGRLEDVVIDPDSGRIMYGVLSDNGTYYAIPWTVYQIDPSAGTMIVTVSQSQIRNDRGFQRERYPNLSDERTAREIYSRYGQPVYWEQR